MLTKLRGLGSRLPILLKLKGYTWDEKQKSGYL